MRVVSNTGPLINLGKLGQLDLLPKLYGEVMIPPAVKGQGGATVKGDGRCEKKLHLSQGWLSYGI
jgi:predicted nucleic acid-binding protein